MPGAMMFSRHLHSFSVSHKGRQSHFKAAETYDSEVEAWRCCPGSFASIAEVQVRHILTHAGRGRRLGTIGPCVLFAERNVPDHSGFLFQWPESK